MKSMCQEARRNSPSVADCRPTCSCILIAPGISWSSTERRSAAEIRPAAKSSRACSSRWGRSRLPTWSARNGGLVLRAIWCLLGGSRWIGQVDRVLGHAERLTEDAAHKILRHEAVGAGPGAGGDRDADAVARLGDRQVVAVSREGGGDLPGPFGINHFVTSTAVPDRSPKIRTTIEVAAFRAPVARSRTCRGDGRMTAKAAASL